MKTTKKTKTTKTKKPGNSVEIIKGLAIFVLCSLVFIPGLMRAKFGEVDRDEVAVNLQKAERFLLGKKAPLEDCKQGFYFIMESVKALLPQTDYSTECKEKFTAAHKVLKLKGIFSQQGMKLLRESYRLLNWGKAFEMPEISSISEAKKIGKKKMFLAAENLKQEKDDKTVKLLLEILLMTMTPIK